MLKVGETGQTLVSVSFKSIRVWDTAAWRRLWSFGLEDRCMDISFLDEDRFILVALRNNALLFWVLTRGTCGELPTWLTTLHEGSLRNEQQPLKIGFSTGGSLVGVSYRGEDIIVWDIENEEIVDILGQDVGSRGPYATRHTGQTFLFDMVMNHSAESGLLAASYTDGELLIYDFFSNVVRARSTVNAHFLTSSPDGVTLACGNSAGLIMLYEFDTLQLLYRISSGGFAIRSLAFSADSCRLIDIRGRSARVWGPPVLVSMQQDTSTHDLNSDTISLTTTPEDVDIGNIEDFTQISALLFLQQYGWVICGKSDGSIYLYDGKTGTRQGNAINGPDDVPILSLIGNSEAGTIVSVNDNNNLDIYKMPFFEGQRTMLKLFSHQPKIQARQILLKQDASQMLVSSQDQDILYDFQEEGMEEPTSHLWPDRRRFRWTNHPISSNQLILMMDRIAHIFTRDDLSRLTPKAGIQITASIIPKLAISNIVHYQSPSFSFLATTYAESLTSRSRGSRLFLFDASDFTPARTAAAPIPHYRALADKIECIIGTLSSHLVSLQQDGWVCSVELSHDRTPPIDPVGSIERHFFFPADWLTSPTALLISLMPNGDIVFAQRDEGGACETRLGEAGFWPNGTAADDVWKP
ncbi:MAG: hypothetical protein LQ340_003445 [Diploschistes diacapsis]|nr:MAG: hypothetical protein LQ340_003445 [Diploschistes diacapsis]